LLAAPDATLGICADLAGSDRIVLGGELKPLGAVEGPMDEARGSDALIEAVGEIPVLVRVEVGEARMAARDWASLTKGDVIALGRRVGEHVVLRVSGVPVARGDLVEIDGEIAVRIVERLDGDRAAQ
jgi:flagellar motor switch/type III secretory pathway protein FliN